MKKGNKPIWEDNDSNICLASFKNPAPKGVVTVLTNRAFPYKYTKKVYLTELDCEKLIKLLDAKPKFIIKPKEDADTHKD